MLARWVNDSLLTSMTAIRAFTPSAPPSNIRIYNGLEEEGHYYFNARWYDAQTGRFISEDPIRAGSNWNIYVNNNPLKFIDPTGLDPHGMSPEEADEKGWKKSEKDDDGNKNDDKDNEKKSLDNEIGKRDAALENIDNQLEKLNELYEKRAELGSEYQDALNDLAEDVYDYVDSVDDTPIDQVKDVVENAMMTLGDATPEFSGFDLVKSVKEQISGFQERRTNEITFYRRKVGIHNYYNDKISDLDDQIGYEQEKLDFYEEELNKTDETISELKYGY